ncbi:MAG: SDR family oxidoreductase [Rhodococcus sp. (in: high G+C Gram-positive bacteria)]
MTPPQRDGLLAGKVVVVSGVGPGLGTALALRCASAGADIVLAARTRSRLDEVAEQVRLRGTSALAVQTDITDEASVDALVNAVAEVFGRVDAVVNNAFAIPPLEDLAATEYDAIRDSFETCVYGSLRLTKGFADMLDASNGSVVMINSAVRHHSRRKYGGYKMAKSALLAMAQSLATELGPRGIRVNSVAPGYIWADTLKWYFGMLAEQRGIEPHEVYDTTAAKTDLRRLPEPDEIADTVVFLLSSMASAVTGQCIDVNCGEFHS